jgi:4-aminobutyrate aminotransferase/(S)-3-amino-2-methylpropionate transaminase
MSMLERIVTEIPGPRSRALATSMRRTEARGVTFVSAEWPVFWESADGAVVTDVDGNRYLDLTSAFGVAAAGHGNRAVARAIARQAETLMHGMGDVHPSDVKIALLERLAALSPFESAKTFLCSSGAEAVEFALKTAMLLTEAPNALAFGGGYHGLSYGTLEVNGNPKFRKPFLSQLRQKATFARFPDARENGVLERALEAVRRALRRDKTIGALIVEPIQGRAGVIVPPDGFLAGLREITRDTDVLFILDEIYTGFGRTGRMFACEREGVRPDILCVGKALSGGFPISAAIGSGGVMDAWAPSQGEALHTSTFLGNPMGCAAALANLDQLESKRLPERAASLEGVVRAHLRELQRYDDVVDVRGRGLMWGIEMRDGARAGSIVQRALQAGVILLQSGLRGEVLSLAPPLTIEDEQLSRALELVIAKTATKIPV